MKKLLVGLAILFLAGGVNAQIVNNTNATAADSITVPFLALDSVGNITTLTTNDSVGIIVYNPNGAVAAFTSTVAYNNAAIAATTIFSGTTFTAYGWRLSVADIDGATSKDGVYNYVVIAKDITSASLGTPWRGTFQIYQTRDFNTWADSALTELKSLQAMNKRLFPKRGVTLATTGTTGFHSAALTEAATDYWKNNIVVMVNGIDSGEARVITAFTPSTDSITFTPALTTAPATGDSFYISSFICPVVISKDDFVKINIDSATGDIAAAQIENAAITGAKTTFTAGGVDSVQIDESTLGTVTGMVVPTVTTTTNLTTNNDKTGYTLSTAGIDALLETDTSTISGAGAVGTRIKESLRPITYGRQLAVTAAGHTGIDLDNTAGQLNSGEFEDSAFTVAKFKTNTLQRFASLGADSTWKSNFVARDGVAGSLIDSAGGWGATGGTDTTNIKTMINNNWNLAAMQSRLGVAGREKDSTCLVRYVSLSGDNTDGKSWATAWNSPSAWVDSANAFWKNIAASSNYDGMNIIYFSADSFMTAGKLCSLRAPNTWMIGAGEWGLGRPATTITRRATPHASPAASSDDSDLVKIYADNCHIINFTMNAVDTAGDPDFGSGTGGNNAITFDTISANRGVVGGEVAYCYFPYWNHKPVQANARGSSRQVAYNIWIHDNYFFRPKKHAIDGFFRSSLIENNFIIGPRFAGDHATGAAGIQIIGTNSDSMVARSNIIRNNYIQQMDVGVAILNTDSNTIQGNVFNFCGTAAWTVSIGYNSNVFIDNKINNDAGGTDNALITGGLLGNPSFETWRGTKYTPYDWGGANSSVGSGVRSEIHYDTPRSGGWNYLIKGSTNGTPTQGYLNTKLLELPKGRYTWSAWFRGDDIKPAFDTVSFVLYKYKTSGDSALTEFTARYPEVDTINYNKIGAPFTIRSEGKYYLSFLANPISGDSSNGFFLDDIQVFPHIGDTLLANIGVSFGANDSVYVKGGFVDSNKTEQGGIAGATILWTVYVVDTSGTDQTVAGQQLAIQDGSGTTRLSANTLANGSTVFTVTSGTWNAIWSNLAGYTSSAKSVNVTANRTDTVFGYNWFIPPATVANTCNVQGTVGKIDGTPLQFADVTITLPSNVRNTCNSQILMARVIKTQTDANGQFLVNLVWSACVDNAKYNITIEHPDYTAISDKFTVPSTTTLALTWGP